MTAAEELRKAAALLAADLPEDFRAEPRLVYTDSESRDGIAFCAEHPDDDPLWEYSACDYCEVIETHNVQLAELLFALLRARKPLAAQLLETEDLHEEATHRGVTRQGCQWCADEDWPCSDMRHAVAVARAVLGEVAHG